MISFKIYFEDFNNWRSPVYADQAGPDVANLDPSKANNPVGAKGAQGATWPGQQQQVDVKLPKKKRNKLAELKKSLAKIKAKLEKIRRK